jgi:charged multivesicular body protein 4
MQLFGKAKKAPTPKDSIVRLRETLDMLEKRERFLETKIENEVKVAKANVHKNKRGKLKWRFLIGVNYLLWCSCIDGVEEKEGV